MERGDSVAQTYVILWCNICLMLLLKLMYSCALLGYPHKEERNDDCRRIKVTRCAMPNQHIFKLDVPERLVRLDWWILMFLSVCAAMEGLEDNTV